MEQNVKFELVDENGNELESIECKVEFEEDGDMSVNFFDSHTGYSNNSSARGAQGNWYYQDDEAQENIKSLIDAVDSWQDWTENLSWTDGGQDTFEFVWDGESRTQDGLKDLERA